MKKILILFYIFSCVIFLSHAQNTSLAKVPTHESKIIMMGLHRNTLYTLDSNALLRITNTQTLQSDFAIPVRTKLRQAFFSYPYIVLVDNTSTMHIYNIENQYLAFSAAFLDQSLGGAIAFSSDLSLFTFTAQNYIAVYTTTTWSRISQIDIANTYPQYLFISKSNQNLMSYFSDGKIQYYNIQKTSLLKAVRSEVAIQKIILNSTLRYAIGHNSSTLNTIDLINGNIVDTILFNERILSIYTSTEQKQETKPLTTLSQQYNGSQYLRTFSLLNDGNIREHDLQTITLPKTSSSGISNDTHLYIGFEDGEVWRYPLHSANTKHKVIIEDNTLAIYDSVYINKDIYLASVDGIYSVPLATSKNNLTNNNIQFSRFADTQLQQQLYNPSFVLPTRGNLDTLYILSTNVPYDHTLPNLLALEERLAQNPAEERSPQKTQTQGRPSAVHTPSLLYDLNLDSSNIPVPHSLAPSITYLYKDEQYSIAHSTIDSLLYIYSSQERIEISLFTSRFLSSISYDSASAELILWTNTPLLADSKETKILANTIYSYRISGATVIPMFSPYSLPFETEIINFSIVNNNPTIMLVSTIDSETKYTTILLITMPEQTTSTNGNIDPTNTERTGIYPKKTVILSEIPKERIIKIIAPPRKPTISLLFSEHNMRVLSLNSETFTLHYEYKLPYPKELGIVINATISPIVIDGVATPTHHIISVTDTNNTVSTFLLTEHSVSHLVNFNVRSTKGSKRTIQYF